MSMMPNTSVSPAASRNSISPNWTPFSPCSRNRIGVMNYDPDPELLLHRAVFGPVVAEVDHSTDLLGDHAQVVVLHRRAVVRHLEIAARRFDALRSRHQRLVEALLVLDLAFDRTHRRVDHQRRGIALLGEQ